MARTKRGRYFHHTEGSTASRHGFQTFIRVYGALKPQLLTSDVEIRFEIYERQNYQRITKCFALNCFIK